MNQIEETKQSQFSPGPVLSEETLLRIIFFPDHIDDDGKLKPEAIPTQDLRERGFSVYRKLYAKRKKISDVINNYVEKRPERRCRGISPIQCHTVRNINNKDGNQAFNVLDDAKTKDDEAHVGILFSQKYGKAEQKGYRSKLKNEFTAILDTEAIYSALDNTAPTVNKKSLTAKIFSIFGYFFK